MTEQPDWTPWAGGECPVAGDVLVEIKRRKFPNPYGPYPAERFRDGRPNMWAHQYGLFAHDDDIVAYRIVQP